MQDSSLKEIGNTALVNLFESIHTENRWNNPYFIQYEYRSQFDWEAILKNQMAEPFKMQNGDYMDIPDIIQCLLGFFGDVNSSGHIEIFIYPYDNSLLNSTFLFPEMNFDSEILHQIVSLILQYNPTLQKSTNQNGASHIIINSTQEKQLLTIDLNSRQIIEIINLEITPEDFTPYLNVTLQSNLFPSYETFIQSILISTIYYPNYSITLTFGHNSLILRLPLYKYRIPLIFNYLFSTSAIKSKTYTYTIESHELRSISNATLIYFKTNNNISRFYFFSFIQGLPYKSNDNSTKDLLSSIEWSSFHMSLIPIHKSKIPFCNESIILGKKNENILLLVNNSNERAQSLSVMAINSVCDMFIKDNNEFIQKKFVKKRLDAVWLHFDVITSSICNILNDDNENDDLWGKIALITKKNNQVIVNGQRKFTRRSDVSQKETLHRNFNR